MITVNPKVERLSPALVEAYKDISPATLGHALESGMDSAVRTLWKPVNLVGPALTVRTQPEISTALARAIGIAEPGDVIVMDRGGDTRHANWGEIVTIQAVERGIAGLVTDGVVTDRTAIERMRIPVFCRGTSAMTVKRLGIEEGAVNVAVSVGGVVVNPGDMVLADEDGVMIVTPEEAEAYLAYGQEKEAWEIWIRAEAAAGRPHSELIKERPPIPPPDVSRGP